jgi:hypothetical protein
MSSQISCPNCGKVKNIKNIYCIECGFQFEGNNSVEFQIYENLKADIYGSIICIMIFIAFMYYVNVVIIAQYGLYGYISILVIWPLTIGFVVWAKHYYKGLSKFRRFTITNDFIEIIVPHKPNFQINWSEFDSIEITKQDSTTAIPTGDGIILGPRFVYFKLIFKGRNVERSYEFESGKDFKVSSRKKILIALEQYSKERGKDFTGWRWKEK